MFLGMLPFFGHDVLSTVPKKPSTGNISSTSKKRHQEIKREISKDNTK
jgi:hypothetical protein